MYLVKTYGAFSELPAFYGELFEAAVQGSYYLTLPWFDNQARTTGQAVRLYGVESAEPRRAQALYVTRETRTSPWGRGLAAYNTMYTILYGPIARPGATDMAEIAAAFARQAALESRPLAVIQFDAMDRDGEAYVALAQALRGQGLLVQKYFHFGNQFEDVSHGSYSEFLGKRPSTLRNTLKRKRKKFEKTSGTRIVLLDGTEGNEGLDGFIAAYDHVYAASWKDPEPFPDFTPGLVRTAAAAGALRAGVIYVHDEPAAAQIWLVAGGKATIFKLAYDEKYTALSVGSILTEEIARRVIEVDGVAEIDFGRGDDPYKATWLSERREHWGLMAFNPRTLGGALGACRHIGGGALKRALRSVRQTVARDGSGG